MEWWNTLVIVLLLLLAVFGLARPFMKLERRSSQDVDRLLNYLQNMGIYVSLLEVDRRAARRGARGASGERCLGAIKVGGRNMEVISVVSKTTPFGDHLFTDYSVGIGLWLGKTGRRKTGLIRKGALGMLGRGVDIEWKGDELLSRELNYDPRLKDKLGKAEMEGNILVLPDGEYAKVRLTYQLPSADLFGAVDIIAGHIKSVW